MELKVNFVSKLIVKSVTFEVDCRFSWNRRGNRAACTTAETSGVSLIEYCKVTTQHQLARVPSVSRDARRARRSGQSGKVKGICSELGTSARMMRIALVRSGHATEYVACLGPGR